MALSKTLGYSAGPYPFRVPGDGGYGGRYGSHLDPVSVFDPQPGRIRRIDLESVFPALIAYIYLLELVVPGTVCAPSLPVELRFEVDEGKRIFLEAAVPVRGFIVGASSSSAQFR